MREERRETGGVSEEWSAYRLVVVEEERAVVLLRHLFFPCSRERVRGKLKTNSHYPPIVNSYFSGKLCF